MIIVNKYRWDANSHNGEWKLYRTVQVTEEKAIAAIEKYKNNPTMDFYMYQIGTAIIFCSDANLFD